MQKLTASLTQKCIQITAEDIKGIHQTFKDAGGISSRWRITICNRW